MSGLENGWECAICLGSQIEIFGIYYQHKLKCDHIFHIGCIQHHFLTKNKIWEDPNECVLECPLCRDKTIRNNYGVNVVIDAKNKQMIMKKGDRQLVLSLTIYGKDVFKRDVKMAKTMLQRVADLCFNVDCYWEVAQNIPLDKLNKLYMDDEKQCVKQINLPQNQDDQVYIERSYGV